MWRLHRYLFLSTAAVAFSAVGLVIVLLIAGNVVGDMVDAVQEGQATPDLLLQVIPLLIPYTFSFAMPVGCLIAVLVVIGRISASNELTAMKASGISLWRVAAPLVLFCLFCTAVTAWLNASSAPAARGNYREMLANAVRSDPLRFFVPRRFVHDFPGYVVYVDEKQGDLVRRVWLWELDEQKRVQRLLRADAGSLRYDADKDGLVLSLENGYAELRDPTDLSQIQPSLFFDQASFFLSLGEIFAAPDVSTSRVKHLPLDQKLNRLALLNRRFEHAPPDEQKSIRQEAVEIQFRIQLGFANAFSAVSLGLLGIPLGLKASRRETSVNVFIALGLLLTYYLVTQFIASMDSYYWLRPDLLVWVPNLLCQGAAFWLFVRANRH